MSDRLAEDAFTALTSGDKKWKRLHVSCEANRLLAVFFWSISDPYPSPFTHLCNTQAAYRATGNNGAHSQCLFQSAEIRHQRKETRRNNRRSIQPQEHRPTLEQGTLHALPFRDAPSESACFLTRWSWSICGDCIRQRCLRR